MTDTVSVVISAIALVAVIGTVVLQVLELTA